MFLMEQKKDHIQNMTNKPINVYGMTKYLSEKYVTENANFAYVIRTSWLYSKTSDIILQKYSK